MLESLIAPVNFDEFHNTFNQVQPEYQKRESKTEEEIQKALCEYPRPTPIPLDKHADVRTADQLFSPKQTAQLGLLKSLILKIADENVRITFMLMFSGLITKNNLTYHNNPNRPWDGQGNASAFQYYRYRLAPRPIDADPMKYFKLRYDKVFKAKEDISFAINPDTVKNARIIKGTATDLSFLEKESVDYIYTDPPYGKKYRTSTCRQCGTLGLTLTWPKRITS